MLPPNIAALIIDPKIYAFPYVIMIMILAIVALTLFIKFPSLKNYRRRRSIIFYTVLFLAFMLLIFQAYDVGSRALVSYGVEFDVRFYPEKTNQLNLTCSSDGGRYCSFYMIVSSVNASFPAQTQPNYVQVNSTVIRVHFTLSENWFSRSKTTESVLFNIDKNVTGFSFTLRLDSWSKGCLFISGQPFVSYVWNGTENCFVPYEDGIWVA